MKIELFSRKNPPCPFCINAKRWLQANNLPYEEFDVMDDGVREKLEVKLGHPAKTVPQIFIDDKLIGGFTDLVASDFAKSLIHRDIGSLSL